MAMKLQQDPDRPMKFIDKLISEVNERVAEEDDRPYFHKVPSRNAEEYTEVGRMRNIAESGLMPALSTLFPQTKDHAKHIKKTPEKVQRNPRNDLWLKEQGDKFSDGGDKIVEIPEEDDELN